MTDREQERAAALDPATFRLRRFVVTVEGMGEGLYLATSRGKAMSDAWRCDAFSHLTYGEFLKIARCRLDHYQPKPCEITVGGERCWGLGNNGQYVQFVRPDGEFVLNSHPLDVLPEDIRPRHYRTIERTEHLRNGGGEG
jgi:hypothetical protein